jgi:hypothetical protein
MDSQPYLRAKRQELQGERLVEEQETMRRRDIMPLTEEYGKATTHTKEKKMQQAHVISEAREQAQRNGNGQAWRWRVEPGMEEAFRDLLGWMLSSQRDAEMETANSPPQPSPSVEGESRPASEPQPRARGRGKGRLASEPESLAA